MIINGDAARLSLKDESIHCCVTSPPYYGLRLYAGLEPQIWGDGWVGHLGNEPTPELYITHLVEVGREMWRVLRDDGVWFLNLGDSFWGGKGQSGHGNAEKQEARREAGVSINQSAAHVGEQGKTRPTDGKHNTYKPKDKMLIPHRVALALQADGWTLRQDMPWLKTNPMPESVTDRPTTAHEYIFILTKSARVFWDNEAVKRASTPDSVAREKRGVSRSHKNTNGAPGQPPHTFNQFRENDPNRKTNGTRQFRTTDPWRDSLELAIAETQARLDHLQAIRDAGGMLQPEGEPLGLLTSLKGYAGAHYATFPLEMVLPLIKAATSEAGCCPMCGGQWVRVVEKVKGEPDSYKGSMFTNGKTKEMKNGLSVVGDGERTARTITTGWRPSCSCPDHAPISALVLDPFAGSGTVGEACRKLGRRFIGLDLSAEYLAKNAAARAEQMTTEAGLTEARQHRRPRQDKRTVKQVEAGQLEF